MWKHLELVLCCCYSFLPLISSDSGVLFTNHEPGGLIDAGTKCVEAYLQRRLPHTEECTRLRNHLDEYKDMGAADMLINQPLTQESTWNKIRQSLREDSVLSRMREILANAENVGKDELESVCKAGYFPYLTMRELVNVYDAEVWTTLKQTNNSEYLLNMIFERLEQLAGVVSWCGRIQKNNSEYLLNIRKYLWNMKERVRSEYAESKREKITSIAKYEYVKKKLVDLEKLDAIKTAKDDKVEKEAVESFYREWGHNVEFDQGVLDEGVAVFSALKELGRTGKMSADNRELVGKSVLKLFEVGAQLVPVPFVATAVSVITSLIGFAITSDKPAQKTEVQVLSESIDKKFEELTKEMKKQFTKLTKELHDQNMLHLVTIPGQIIRHSIESYTATKNTKNMANVCNSITKNTLFAAMDSYVTDSSSGYFAKTMNDFGTIPMFDQIHNVTTKYLLDALHAQALCHGMTTVSGWFEEGKLRTNNDLTTLILEDNKMDPYMIFLVKKYKTIYNRLADIRPKIEDNAMEKAEQHLVDFLTGLDLEHSTDEKVQAATHGLVDDMNRLWSINYEFAVMWGKIDSFTITHYIEFSGSDKSRHKTSNVIVSRKMADEGKSYAVIRKLKSINRERLSPLFAFSRRLEYCRSLGRYQPPTKEESKKYKEKSGMMQTGALSLSIVLYEVKIFDELAKIHLEVGEAFGIARDRAPFPPFINASVPLTAIGEPKGQHILDDVTYDVKDGEYDMVYSYSLGTGGEGTSRVFASTGTGDHHFKQYKQDLYSSVFGIYVADEMLLNTLASTEIDPLTEEDKRLYKNALY